MNPENQESNYLLFSLMKKTFIYTYISFLFSNRLFWNYLRRNKNVLENDLIELNKKSDDINNRLDNVVNDNEINYISFDSIKKFREVTNPEEYTITNLRRAISNESLKDIFNYHQNLINKNKESINKIDTSIKE